jgi:Protein of unknown function (DUF2971)
MSGAYEECLSAVPRDMMDALAKFGHEAEEIVDAFLTRLEAAPPPPILYHYTNDVGLRGILESGKLWLTDILSLNDPSELSHGLSHAVTILSGKAGNGPPESKLFAADFEEMIRLGKVQRSGDYFICSFSSAGDDLGQWRAYADNGRGYVLGFDASALEDAFIRQAGAPIQKAFPITYNDARLIEIHRNIIEQVFALISLPHGRNLGNEAIKGYIAELYTVMTVHTLHAGLHFKHEAYANEREYRFMQVHPPSKWPPATKLRTRSYSSIRYQEFDWKDAGRNVLKNIVIGPAADIERARKFAKEALLLVDQEAVSITCSRIPYRAS